MLGLDLNTSNAISKEQDEKLHARELRRKALRSRSCPKAVWTFVLNSAILGRSETHSQRLNRRDILPTLSTVSKLAANL